MVVHGNKIAAQSGEILIRLDIKTVVVVSFDQTSTAHTGKKNYVVFVEPLEKRWNALREGTLR